MKGFKDLVTRRRTTHPALALPAGDELTGEHLSEDARRILDALRDAIITSDISGTVTHLNHAAEQLIGQKLAAVRGQLLSAVLSMRDDASGRDLPIPVEKVLREARITDLPHNATLIQKSGRQLAIEASVAPVFGSDGRIVGTAITLHDVTKTRELATKLTHQAHHDTLTGLPNRGEFNSRVKRALESARARHVEHALCLIDIDQFKVINDTCGHAAGDELLRQIGGLLQSRLRERDTVARLGGDEFGLLLEACPLREAEALAGSLLSALQGFRFRWQEKSIAISVSIGLTAITASSDNIETIVSASDAACNAAKEKGRNRVQVYAPGNPELADRKSEMRLISGISDAIDGNRFVLYIQPILALGARAGGDHYEILARMISPHGDLILPGHFIPAAERYNLMPGLDRLIIRNAFAAYRKVYPANGKRDLNTWAINVSGASLGSEGFIDFIREQSAIHHVPPQAICFEITETAAIANLDKALDFIWGLKIEGFRFALDDFGKGMSSFSYLKNLPVDYLKIDGEFIREMAHDKVSAGMVDAIHRVAHLMGLETIAEYVENDHVLKQLRQMGVNFAQGYGIGKPASIEILTDVAIPTNLISTSSPGPSPYRRDTRLPKAHSSRKSAPRAKSSEGERIIL